MYIRLHIHTYTCTHDNRNDDNHCDNNNDNKDKSKNGLVIIWITTIMKIMLIMGNVFNAFLKISIASLWYFQHCISFPLFIYMCVYVYAYECVHLRICTYLHICLYLSSCFFSVHYWSPQSLPQWLTFCFAIVFIHLQLPLSHLWPSWSARVNCLNNLIRCYCLHE